MYICPMLEIGWHNLHFNLLDENPCGLGVGCCFLTCSGNCELIKGIPTLLNCTLHTNYPQRSLNGMASKDSKNDANFSRSPHHMSTWVHSRREEVP